jgi:hypothetical protein
VLLSHSIALAFEATETTATIDSASIPLILQEI